MYRHPRAHSRRARLLRDLRKAEAREHHEARREREALETGVRARFIAQNPDVPPAEVEEAVRKITAKGMAPHKPLSVPTPQRDKLQAAVQATRRAARKQQIKSRRNRRL